MLGNEGHDYPKKVFREKNFELVFFVYPVWENFIETHSNFLTPIIFNALKHISLKTQKKRTDSIHITFCDNQTIHQLNYDYRNTNKPTNVLSFPAFSQQELEDKEYLFGNYQVFGDIFISYDYCYDEAIKNDKSFDKHTAHMLVHGVLHVFGFDHQDPLEADIMETLEATILKTFNINNPYE